MTLVLVIVQCFSSNPLLTQLRNGECEEGTNDVSCKFEEGALWVEVTRTDSQEVEENGCSGDGSNDGKLCHDGSDSVELCGDSNADG